MKKKAMKKIKRLFSKARIKNFIRKSFLGGLTVIIPFAAILAIFSWLWKLVVETIHPITSVISDKSGMNMLFAEIIAIALILAICFFVGVFVSTAFGKWFHGKFDRLFTKLAPGYNMLKGVFTQLLKSEGGSSFINGQPVFAFPFGRHTAVSVTGYISARDETSGIISVYCPIPMNPSSGIVYHVPQEDVIEINGVSNEDVLRTIIGFGTGSNDLVKATPLLSEHYRSLKRK